MTISRGQRTETSGEGYCSDDADFINSRELSQAFNAAHGETLKLHTEFTVYEWDEGVFRESQFSSDMRIGTSHTWLGREKELLFIEVF